MEVLNLLMKSDNISESDMVKHCKQIVQDIQKDKLTILEVTTKLQELVGSPDGDKQEIGLWILSTILQQMPITLLKHDEVVQFCMFYKCQLKGRNKLLMYTLNAILALSRWNSPMPERCFTEVVTTMFQSVACQAQMHSHRLEFYQIMQTLLETQKQEILDLGPDYIYGVISAIDGEREPRNLLWLFRWLPTLISTIPLGHLVDEMFDVISCYFPIDFRVPAESAQNISRDALAEALKPCLCAHAEFAVTAIELALEKLDSDLRIAKVDSLQLLIHGCQKFPTDAYFNIAKDLWTKIHKEMSTKPPREIELLLLTLISELSRTFSTGLQFESVFDDILQINLKALRVGESGFECSSKFLIAISQANRACAQLVLPQVEPRLVSSFALAEDAKKVELLCVLSEFLKVGNMYQSNVPDLPQCLCELLKQEISHAYNETRQQVIVELLHCLCFVTQQITNAAKCSLLDILWSLFISENLPTRIKRALHDCVTCYAEDFCKLIGRPNKLIDSSDASKVNAAKLFLIIEHLTCLSVHQTFTNLAFDFLSFYFHQYPHVCLQSLRKIWELNEAQNKDNIKNAIRSEGLIEHVLDLSNCQGGTSSLEDVREILNKYMGELNVKEQSELLDHYLPIITSAMQQNGNAIGTIVYYFSGLLTNVHSEILKISSNNIDRLFSLSVQGNQVATELLASIVNKLSEEEVKCVISFEKHFEAELSNEGATNINDLGNVLVWLTKALYMRGFHRKLQWTTLLMAYIPRSHIVAQNLKIVCNDWSLCNANRKLLYRQAFLSDIYQPLCESFSVENPNYITSLGSLIESAPQAILKQYFLKMMRLIVLCLENHQSTNGVVAILSTMYQFIVCKDDLSLQYVNEFIPRLLNIAIDGKAMELRILALRCLGNYINDLIPLYVLLPYKAQVIDALAKCIDDKKRLVRKEAVDARMKWYLLDAPQ